MKIILIVMLLIADQAMYAQLRVPATVSIAFAKKFPDATHVKWGKENAREFEAEFELKGRKMSANFDFQGNCKETETEIDVVDLPAAIARSIAAKYPGAVISAANKIEKARGKIFYEADLKIKGKKMEVELLADGRFLK